MTDLTPTGRGGGFVRASEVPLSELLRRYDAAFPDHTDMDREKVIASYQKAATQH